MIKRWTEFINENNSYDIIVDRMDSLYKRVGQYNNLSFDWEYVNDFLIIDFNKGSMNIRWEFHIDNMNYIELLDGELSHEENVDSIESLLDHIEYRVMYILNISEAKSEKYKGRKIPGKYLVRKKGAMKKEIDTFRGKSEFKKDWEADYDRRSGKRIKTKKSAATKSYQKKFGNK